MNKVTLSVRLIEVFYLANSLLLTAQTSPSPSETDLKPPLHYWRFDEVGADQTSPDTGSSADKIPAKLTGATLVTGKFGKAVDFQATGTTSINPNGLSVTVTTNLEQLVTIPFNLNTLSDNGFTISFWFKGTLPKAGYSTFLDAGRKNGIEIRMNTVKQVVVNVGHAWNILKTPTNFQGMPDQWTQVAVTYNGNKSELFVNGAQIDSQDINPSNFPDHITLGGFFEDIASQGSNASTQLISGFVGDLDDLQIFDCVLTADRIAQLYKITPPTDSSAQVGSGQ